MLVENEKDLASWLDELVANAGLWIRDPTRKIKSWLDPEKMLYHMRAEWVISDPPTDMQSFRAAALKHSGGGPQIFKTPDGKEHTLRHMHYDIEVRDPFLQKCAQEMMKTKFMSMEQFTKFENRPTWEEYFLKLAELAATRSVCERAHCGAVIVKDNNVISTGYNGAPRHQKNCKEMGFCYRNKNNVKSGTSPELCRAAGCHSEANAIALAAKHGHATNDAVMYVYGNTDICSQCKGQIANAGIRLVIYRNKEDKVQVIRVADQWNVHPVDKT